MIHPIVMTHPTALIDSRAQVHSTCTIGPYCVVGAGVQLGEHCELMSHVVIHGPSKIGAHNRFFPFCAIGGGPPDLSYKGGQTRLENGNHQRIPEYQTLKPDADQGSRRNETCKETVR